ncbi:hypothetical protein A4C53_RS16565 [Elizabethkingia anophelis]|nr:MULTISPECIES: hypothetical protein [Elizabethkingia]EGT4348703.1 hypothetical protein [Elizabethkingia anophelis]EJG2053018.1 hypothetical protein [Elizabethkingia anophelis]EJG2061742.1 hypothetical protein [Elizabethkingia anophelis]EJG2065414.1 hypothetical protein [Elizabethkingia anophelis]EJG2069091.1 hypothetical protein [Elizabethkingia anophelis]
MEQKNTLQKKEYLPPTLTTEFVEMEEGIAANSANVNPVNTDSNTPSIEDWNTQDTGGDTNFDF